MEEASDRDRNGRRVDTAGFWNPARFALWLSMVVGVLFWDVLSGTRVFVFRDFGLFGYPLAWHHRESFWSGTVPLWNPLNNSGLPFLAQWNTLVCYPLSAIYLLLLMPWSLNLYPVLHLLVAGLGMYFLCQRWTANRFAAFLSGTAYSFNGLTLNCLMWPNNIATLAWMPWVVWLVADGCRKGGKTLYVAAVVGAIQMLSGAPEVILFTWLLTGALFLVEMWRERPAALAMSVRFTGIVGLIALLSAVQLLPFIDLLRHSQRIGTLSYESAMPAWGWANLVTPLFHCHNSGSGVYFQRGQNWTSSYYAGVGTLLLALTALRLGRRPIAPALWGICLIALIFALGNDGWLYKWLRAVFPQFGVMNFPIKFVVPVCFLLPLLAGLGAAAFSQAEHRNGTAGPSGCSVAGRQTWSALTGLLCAIIVKKGMV